MSKTTEKYIREMIQFMQGMEELYPQIERIQEWARDNLPMSGGTLVLKEVADYLEARQCKRPCQWEQD